MQAISLDQSGRDTLTGLGLTHRFPVHIDVVNNETGFALYVETPAIGIDDDGWGPLFGLENERWVDTVHVDDYVAGMRPVYAYDNWYDDMYLRIREVDAEGNTGTWHTVALQLSGFAKNTNPPAALRVDEFDSVTWLEGLQADKDYQVQVWFDQDENGQLNTTGRWERGEIHHVFSDDDPREDYVELADWYEWVEPDLYSGIHNINTDAEDFNVDIDSDGTMDFFIA